MGGSVTGGSRGSAPRRTGRAIAGAAIQCLAAAAAVAFFIWNIARFFPNAHGTLGYDYGYYLPPMLAGFFWQSNNGVLSPPELLPSFCGGVPFLFNPNSIFYSLPQWLMTRMPPVASLLTAWLILGLGGGLGMYGLLRRVFATSSAAALLGATIFLLNGFFTFRMVIGHPAFQGVMLLPAIALALFPAVPSAGGSAPGPATPAAAGSRSVRGTRRTLRILLRAVLGGILLAAIVYSGGVYVVLPAVLTFLFMALMLAYLGRWDSDTAVIAASACLLAVALSAYKLFPEIAFAAHVTRPVTLRMTPNLAGLIGGAATSLFVPQILSHLDPQSLVVDRAELEYGVGIVPLLVLLAGLVVAFRRHDLRPARLWGVPGPAGNRRRLILLGAFVLLIVPILVNWDALGLRWLMLHLPIVRAMSVMLRFWTVYIFVLCLSTALLLDCLVRRDPVSRDWARTMWAAAAIALTIAQCGATDVSYYADQPYDPAPITASYQKVRAGGAVPPITRVADPWLVDGRLVRTYTARNDALVEGVSDVPCYEPMFGYKLQIFRMGRLASGPVLEAKDGRLNLKNPACYVFPDANDCQPGDEFTVAQTEAAAAFASYRPFAYVWPLWEYIAAGVTMATGAFCLLVLLAGGSYLLSVARRGDPLR
jgi:hypothetical protein